MNTTDKELLLLGILRSHQSHGYELNSLLTSSLIPIKLGKANAYQILKRLSERGWITAQEEREGNRPPRRIYSITPAGEEMFQNLLRERTASHVPAVHADAVSLNFLDLLPKKEALNLLSQRMEALERQLNELQELTAEGTGVHYGVAFMLKHAEFELNWLSGLITELAAETENDESNESGKSIT